MYKIIRVFADDDIPQEVVATGLTLNQAQAHCLGLQSSSNTCTSPEGAARTEEFGPWFDGWTDED